MPRWTLSSSKAAITEAVRIFRAEVCGPQTVAELTVLLKRKESRLSVYWDGNRSMAQVWLWKERRGLWKIECIGFDVGLTPQAAMRAHLTRMRSQQTVLGLQQVYSVAEYPSGSARYDRFIETLEAQAWELVTEKKDGTIRFYRYDRREPETAPGDNEWRRRG